MLQIGNLAIVCAGRSDVLMQTADGKATVLAGNGPERRQISMDWRDDAGIGKLIYELNHGSLREGGKL